MTEEKKEIENKVVLTLTLDSEKAQITVEKSGKWRVGLTVSAKPALLAEAHKAALKQIAKDVSIPGFRKGKAPQALIEKKYPGAVKEATEKALADAAFKEAQSVAKIPLLHGNSNVSYKAQTLTDKEAVLSFHFETEPSVPHLDIKEFALKDVKKEIVDDEKVSETLDNIRSFYATWEQITDRGVEMGDFVVLDIDDLEQDPPAQVFSGTRLEVAPKKMATWMSELLVGKKIGDAVDGISRAEETDSEEIKNEFKAKKVRLHVKGIEKANLPPVDDELAGKLGVSDVATLRTRLKELQTGQMAEGHKRELRDNIAEQLIEKVQFEIPASILEKEANHRMSQMMRQPGFQAKWQSSMSEEEKESKKAEILKESDNAIRLFYICRKIVTDNNISLSEEEFAPQYNSLLEMMFADPARVNHKNQSEAQRAMEFSKFMLQKAEDFVIAELSRT